MRHTRAGWWARLIGLAVMLGAFLVALELMARADNGLIASFCWGDGSAVDCPCLNWNQDPFAGCANSTGHGADLSVTGDANAGALTFAAGNLPSGSLALLFEAKATIMDGTGTYGQQHGDGLLCIVGQEVTIGWAVAEANGWAKWDAVPVSPLDGWRRFQVLYRDEAGPCGGGFNTTGGLALLILP